MQHPDALTPLKGVVESAVDGFERARRDSHRAAAAPTPKASAHLGVACTLLAVSGAHAVTCNTRLTRFSPTGQALTQKHGAAVFDLYTSAEQLEHAHLHTCSHSQLKKNIIHTWEQHTHSRIVLGRANNRQGPTFQARK